MDLINMWQWIKNLFSNSPEPELFMRLDHDCDYYAITLEDNTFPTNGAGIMGDKLYKCSVCNRMHREDWGSRPMDHEYWWEKPKC